MTAWAALRTGAPNPLVDNLANDPAVNAYASSDEVRGWLDASDYVGDAPVRARALVATIRAKLAQEST